MFKNQWILPMVGTLLAGLVFFFAFKQSNHPAPLKSLPYFGPRNPSATDSGYHKVGPFVLINQFGDTVREREFEGCIYVTDFFFTTCQSICPIMSNRMANVVDAFGDKPNVKFLSVTVNPEHDSVNVLLDYAKAHGAVKGKWHFCTGAKPHLYELARKGFLLNAAQGDGGPNDFIHTQNFALIDPDQHIRGYYDGTDSLDVLRLIKDIRVLDLETMGKK
jgi:protein SCO1/2